MTEPLRPVLDLSGPRLVRAFEALVADCETHGGVERLITALGLKADAFADALGGGRCADLDRETFAVLCAFMSSVRRNAGDWIEADTFPRLRTRLDALLDGAADTSDAEAVDRRIAAFCAGFPEDRKHRWVRDLAAEILHAVWPELYPLMTRWVWDHRANTGVLREIWHGEDVDRMTIPIADSYPTFLMLREELSGFLATNGVFRDVLHYVDLLCARIYAEYICEQGGVYLRTEFSADMDVNGLTRRMLGLDGVDPRTGRSRVKLAGGENFVFVDR